MINVQKLEVGVMDLCQSLSACSKKVFDSNVGSAYTIQVRTSLNNKHESKVKTIRSVMFVKSHVLGSETF